MKKNNPPETGYQTDDLLIGQSTAGMPEIIRGIIHSRSAILGEKAHSIIDRALMKLAQPGAFAEKESNKEAAGRDSNQRQ